MQLPNSGLRSSSNSSLYLSLSPPLLSHWTPPPMVAGAATMATMTTLRHLNHLPFLRTLTHHHQMSPSHPITSLASLSPPSTEEEDNSNNPPPQPSISEPISSKPTKNHYFPKKGQVLELQCESLGFKSKGVCKVPETGFVLMCDRALPGERFVGRVTRRKGSYAEVLGKLCCPCCCLFELGMFWLLCNVWALKWLSIS